MSTITTRENSGIYRMLWVLFIFFAVVIGVYPFLYYITDMSKGGLLSSKPASLLQSAIYMGAFYSHITFGGLALLSGCTQFSKKIRNRYTRIHRTLGTIYVTCVTISGSCAVYIAIYSSGGLVTHFGFGALGVLWLFCTLTAYNAIRHKDITSHRMWMIRSYALCFAAVTLRIYLPLFTAAFHFDFSISYQIISWLCWVPNLVIAEIIIRKLKPVEAVV